VKVIAIVVLLMVCFPLVVFYSVKFGTYAFFAGRRAFLKGECDEKS